MSLQANSWENSLIARAFEGVDRHIPSGSWRQTPTLLDRIELFEIAYQRCDEITRINSRTFHLASSLLPQEKQRAVRALYAFCRISDDLVDRSQHAGNQQVAAVFDAWRNQVLDPGAVSREKPDDANLDHWLVTLAWSAARHQYNIPQRYAEQLMDGISRDLKKNRYNTFEEVVEYSYGVASTVGLMSMYIIGFDGSDAIPYAVRLGVALQLTNILRDVGEDWRGGRLYLPLEELEEFGLSEFDIEKGVVSDKWRRFMRFQIDRVRKLYDESMPGIQLLHPDGRLTPDFLRKTGHINLIQIIKPCK